MEIFTILMNCKYDWPRFKNVRIYKLSILDIKKETAFDIVKTWKA